jgi:diguanylate cyclase (GGDEF)-like protein
LVSLERVTIGILNFTRLSRIRNKILVFALIATLIPSFFMGWLSYRNNRLVLQEKITQELINLTAHASQGLDYWCKDREYEIRVFASSYEVSENLKRLETYLTSVEEMFADYAELLVIDLHGRVVASSNGRITRERVPEAWLQRVEAGDPIVGDLFWDPSLDAAVIPIGEPIRDDQNSRLGVLVAMVDFGSVGEILHDFAPEPETELYIVTPKALVLTSSQPMTPAFMTSTLAPPTIAGLLENPRTMTEYMSFRGNEVVGVLEPIERLGWGVVGHKDRKLAYAPITDLRNTTLSVISAILIIVGAAAYLLGLTIVRPLDRLTEGAAKITSGDLKVRLPVYSSGELGTLTEAFNNMAKRLRIVLGELDETNRELRKKNEELHELSITDALTGLNNRRHMMETLTQEVARAVRYDKRFSILMVDIDQFKNYNDQHGHLAGDEVLRELGGFLKGSLRTEDYAARYGGEEFLLLLPETGPEGAGQLAERLRRRLEEQQIGAEHGMPGITVCVGVAAFPENADDPEELINQADRAMYKAKLAGRNRVMIARGRRVRHQAAG